MNRTFKMIRRFTVPPVFAAVLLLTVYIAYPDVFGNLWMLLAGLLFLSVLPTLAYPLQKYIPRFKDRGREGQRTLAMLFSFVGYLFGTAVSFLFSESVVLKIIYLEYLLCGIGMLLLNKLFHLRASGHACGIVGPVIMLFYLGLYIPAAVGAALIVPVYLSSVKTREHTPVQLLGGSAIPVIVLCLLVGVRAFL